MKRGTKARPRAVGNGIAVPHELRAYTRLIVRAALAEDVGSGDVTTAAVVGRDEKNSARIIVKEPCVVAGLFVAAEVFGQLDRDSVFRAAAADGDRVKKGAVIAEVSGKARALLIGERVALNFLQRLSAVATVTREFVDAVDGTRARILDTRKTTPCLRALEKYAVKAGGGLNHRLGLYDSVLVKDNHIKAAGSLTEAVRRVNRKYKDSAPVEVEARTLDEVREAVRAGVDIILLDNMDVKTSVKALKAIKRAALVEASGGVTLANVRRIARAGVDFISVGALTHSAGAVDISMEFD